MSSRIQIRRTTRQQVVPHREAQTTNTPGDCTKQTRPTRQARRGRTNPQPSSNSPSPNPQQPPVQKNLLQVFSEDFL